MALKSVQACVRPWVVGDYKQDLWKFLIAQFNIWCVKVGPFMLVPWLCWPTGVLKICQYFLIAPTICMPLCAYAGWPFKMLWVQVLPIKVRLDCLPQSEFLGHEFYILEKVAVVVSLADWCINDLLMWASIVIHWDVTSKKIWWGQWNLFLKKVVTGSMHSRRGTKVPTEPSSLNPLFWFFFLWIMNFSFRLKFKNIYLKVRIFVKNLNY